MVQMFLDEFAKAYALEFPAMRQSRITLAFTGRANGTRTTLRNSLRALRCMPLLDADGSTTNYQQIQKHLETLQTSEEEDNESHHI